MNDRLPIVFAVTVAVAVATILAACGADEPSACEVQCRIHRDCGLFATDREEATCAGTCEQMLSGRCDGPGCVELGAGGDPEICMSHLLEANLLAEAEPDSCGRDFIQEWCTTYYEDPHCAPLVIDGIRCR